MHRLCLAVLVTVLGIAAASACEDPQQLAGFKTCADVAKAESEGALVVYATDPEAPSEQVLAKFHALFPQIKAAVHASAWLVRKATSAHNRDA